MTRCLVGLLSPNSAAQAPEFLSREWKPSSGSYGYHLSHLELRRDRIKWRFAESTLFGDNVAVVDRCRCDSRS